MKFGDSHNRMSWWDELFLSWGSWKIAARCTNCGRGSGFAKAEEQGGATERDTRWLCPTCGASWSASIKWVGRQEMVRTAVGEDSSGYTVYAKRDTGTGRYWEWLPVERLPHDLKPAGVQTEFDRAVAAAVERELPKRLDAEFEARVKAAVEVELELQRGKS